MTVFEERIAMKRLTSSTTTGIHFLIVVALYISVVLFCSNISDVDDDEDESYPETLSYRAESIINDNYYR